MTLDVLQKAKIEAIKNKNPMYKEAVSAMIDAVQKASITPKGRIEITEQLIDEVLIKYQKTIQEMIDTCPVDRVATLAEYKNQLEIISEFAPVLMVDETVIYQMILGAMVENQIEAVKKNKGMVMKTIMPMFKGKADMKIVNKVVGEILK